MWPSPFSQVRPLNLACLSDISWLPTGSLVCQCKRFIGSESCRRNARIVYGIAPERKLNCLWKFGSSVALSDGPLHIAAMTSSGLELCCGYSTLDPKLPSTTSSNHSFRLTSFSCFPLPRKSYFVLLLTLTIKFQERERTRSPSSAYFINREWAAPPLLRFLGSSRWYIFRVWTTLQRRINCHYGGEN